MGNRESFGYGAQAESQEEESKEQNITDDYRPALRSDQEAIMEQIKQEEDYAVNTIGSWPRFTSTTTSKQVAITFSKFSQLNKKQFEPEKLVLLYKIYLSNNNSPATHIELQGREWSFYPGEAEVNLLPYFTFYVSEITEYECDTLGNKDTQVEDKDKIRVREITLVEIPCQNLLAPRIVMQSCLIWYDMTGYLNQDVKSYCEGKLPFVQSNDHREVKELIARAVKCVLVIRDTRLIYQMFDGLEEPMNVCSVVVLCEEDELDFKQEELFMFKKVSVCAETNVFEVAKKKLQEAQSQQIEE